MSWQLLISISILLFSFNGLFHRTLMKEENSDPIAQTIAFYGLGGIFIILLLAFRGGFQYQPILHNIPLILVYTVFATAAPVLAFKALKSIGTSENSILSSSARLWVVLGAFFFLHEPFSMQKIVGTVVILGGIIISQWRKEKIDINKGMFYALIAAVAYAIAETISYDLLRSFNVLSYSVLSCFLPVIALIILMPRSLRKLSFYRKPSRAINISIVSVNDTIGTVCVFLAYQVGRNAAQIGPLLATQTILSVILAILILKERDHMVNKIIGAVVVVIGVVLLI